MKTFVRINSTQCFRCKFVTENFLMNLQRIVFLIFLSPFVAWVLGSWYYISKSILTYKKRHQKEIDDKR